MVRLGAASLALALLGAPAPTGAEPPRWGVDGTTIVRGVDALTGHIVILVSEWCTYADKPEVWKEAEEFHGAFDDPTVGANVYGCSYRVIEDGDRLDGAPWDAPQARDAIFYALPRAKFRREHDEIPALDDLPLRSFHARMESGASGVLRAALGPSRGVRVPLGSPLVAFEDVLRAEIVDGVFRMVPESRRWIFRDGSQVVSQPDDPPPAAAPPPASTPPLDPPPAAATPPAPTPPPDPPSPVPDPDPGPTPHSAAPPGAPPPTPEPAPSDLPEKPLSTERPTPPPTSLARALAFGGGGLALGLTLGLALRRPRRRPGAPDRH